MPLLGALTLSPKAAAKASPPQHYTAALTTRKATHSVAALSLYTSPVRSECMKRRPKTFDTICFLPHSIDPFGKQQPWRGPVTVTWRPSVTSQ